MAQRSALRIPLWLSQSSCFVLPFQSPFSVSLHVVDLMSFKLLVSKHLDFLCKLCLPLFAMQELRTMASAFSAEGAQLLRHFLKHTV